MSQAGKASKALIVEQVTYLLSSPAKKVVGGVGFH
jgi:hypothetical protein